MILIIIMTLVSTLYFIDLINFSSVHLFIYLFTNILVTYFSLSTLQLATTKKRYSDTTIQRYRNRNLEPEPGTVHNLCKLEHFAPQEIYIIIIYRGGGGAIQR